MLRWPIWLLLGFSLSLSAAYADGPIPYTLTQPTAVKPVHQHGASVYEKLGRGGFDREPMVEIVPRDNPSQLPPPTVIPFTALSPTVIGLREALYSQVAPGNSAQRPAQRGEDQVFSQISEADRRGRCFLLAEGCERLFKDSVAPTP